jgi:WD40 repeat protein
MEKNLLRQDSLLKIDNGILANVAYSPSGRRLASVSGDNADVSLWDLVLETPKKLTSFQLTTAWVNVLAFTPDETTLIDVSNALHAGEERAPRDIRVHFIDVLAGRTTGRPPPCRASFYDNSVRHIRGL